MEISMNISPMQNKMKFHTIEGQGDNVHSFSSKSHFSVSIEPEKSNKHIYLQVNILLALPMSSKIHTLLLVFAFPLSQKYY